MNTVEITIWDVCEAHPKWVTEAEELSADETIHSMIHFINYKKNAEHIRLGHEIPIYRYAPDNILMQIHRKLDKIEQDMRDELNDLFIIEDMVARYPLCNDHAR